jgi:hypothetical protein
VTIIKPSQNLFLLNAMMNCFIEANSWDYNMLKGHLLTPVCSEYEAKLTAVGADLVEKSYAEILEKLDKNATSLAAKHKTCGMIFNRIGPQAMAIATEELRNNDYYAAYLKIEKYFVNKGSSDTHAFEASAKGIRIKPGQNFMSHWILLQESLKKWAMVLGLQRDRMIKAPIVLGALENPAPPLAMPNVDTLESIANSGELSDFEISQLGHRNLIPENSRIEILEESLKGIDRFELEFKLFYGLTTENKSMVNLLNLLIIRDESKPGQIERESEVVHEKSNNKLSKDETNSKSAIVGKTPPSKYFPPGSCINHPESTTHNTEGCLGGNKSGNQKSPGKQYQKDYEKRHCTYCEKHNKKNPRAFKSHNTEECRINPNKPGNPQANVSKSKRDDEKDGNQKPSKKGRKRNHNSNHDDDESSAYTIVKQPSKADAGRMKFILAHFDELEAMVVSNKGSDKE